MAPKRPAGRSTLPRDEARRRYVEIGQLAALEQIKRDSEALDRRSIAVGPFARLDAGAVAEPRRQDARRDLEPVRQPGRLPGRDDGAGARRGRLDRAARATPRPPTIPTPAPGSTRCSPPSRRAGRSRARRPKVDYAALWALWLSAVPYGLWSERISEPSMEEHVQWVERLEQRFGEAIEHFGLQAARGHDARRPRRRGGEPDRGRVAQPVPDHTPPVGPREPIATFLRRSGRLLWEGATYRAVVAGGSEP